MRFLFKRASSRTPAEAGQTPGRRTVNRQKAPRWGRGHGLVRFAAACFPALLALRSHTVFSTSSGRTENSRPHASTHVSHTFPGGWALTRGRPWAWKDPWGGAHGQRKAEVNPMLPGVPRSGSDEGRTRWTRRRGTSVAVGGTWPGGSCATEQVALAEP